jgi:hypothetical protein
MGMMTGDFHSGYCPICEMKTVFIKRDKWLRDFYLCARCQSIPRWRALIYVLQTHFPNWRDLKVYESSPGGASSAKLRRECKNYLASHFFHGVTSGEMHQGFRCENLERQTFGSGEFDLVITQDVFEHILDPARGCFRNCENIKARRSSCFYCTLVLLEEDSHKSRSGEWSHQVFGRT